MTKKQLEKQEWLELKKTFPPMVINLPLDRILCGTASLGYVTDLATSKKFYFDSLCTVPSRLGVSEYNSDHDCIMNCFDSPPCLAPKNGDRYLHPTRISDKDKLKLAAMFRKEVVSW